MTYLRFSASSVEIKWDGIERTQSASAIGLVFFWAGGVGGISLLLHKSLSPPRPVAARSPHLS